MPKGFPATDAERADAAALCAEVGIAEAHRRTGIPKPTLSVWAKQAGVVLPEATPEAAAILAGMMLTTRQRVAGLPAKLALLADLGLDVTTEALMRAQTGEGDVAIREVVGVWTRAIHDLQLLDGGATERHETPVLTSGAIDAASLLVNAQGRVASLQAAS